MLRDEAAVCSLWRGAVHLSGWIAQPTIEVGVLRKPGTSWGQQAACDLAMAFPRSTFEHHVPVGRCNSER